MNLRKKGIIFSTVFLLFNGLACGLPYSLSELLPAREEISEEDVEPERGEQTKAPGASTRESIPTMAFVVDPHYQPIAQAAMGTNELLTDRYGVAVGEIQANDAGWVPVKAPGYVNNYARPSRFSGEVDLYFVTLVPVQAVKYAAGTSDTRLWLREADAPRLELAVLAGSLSAASVLELTVIHPREVRMDDAWAALDPDFTPLVSFDLSAYDVASRETDLAKGGTATLSIQDTEHDMKDLMLRSFDPESGRWITQKNACSRVDEETIQCTLSHFSLHSFMERNLGPQETESAEADAFRDAYRDIGKIYG